MVDYVTQAAPAEAVLNNIEGLVLDCDGVLTPGDLYYDETGKRLLRFNARDGFALSLLCRSGVAVGVLSGRQTDIAEKRLRELGVREFMGVCRDKRQGMTDICAKLGVAPARSIFIGDDLPDLSAYATAGLCVAVGDAVPELKERAHWVTQAAGGRGAVREVCEALLRARGDWQRYVQKALL